MPTFVYRNCVRDRDWIDASKSSVLLSFFYFVICWSFPGQSSSPATQNRVVRCCHCGISTALSLRQKSLASIDSYRQLSTNIDGVPATGRGKHSQPVPYCCRRHVIIYVPLYISDLSLLNFVLFFFLFLNFLAWVHAVSLSVEAPRYEPESRGFDFRLCHWNSSLT